MLRGRWTSPGTDRLIAPSVAKARATYPAARKRFIAGLPPGYKFAVWVRLYDKNYQGRKIAAAEDIFLDVERIAEGRVYGRIHNQPLVVTKYRVGERASAPEVEIRNWVIVRPDHSEEGNFVGKFLDHYKPQ